MTASLPVQRVRIIDGDGKELTELELSVMPRLGETLVLARAQTTERARYRIEEVSARRGPVVMVIVREILPDDIEPPSHPHSDVMRRFYERYAYQTRHGTELGADIVFTQAMNYILHGQLPEDVHSG
jgi:hypothetical protein